MPPPEAEPVVVIAGAGVAGLAAGMALQKQGIPVIILEKTDRVGGLAAGVAINGNIYKFGPHLFHTTDEEVLAEVRRVAGDVLIPMENRTKVKFSGKYFSFPLTVREVFSVLPLTMIVKASASLAYHLVLSAVSPNPKLENSEQALKRFYGDELYKIFFKDYIEKVWGIDPRHMSPNFAKERVPRMPILGLLTLLKKMLFRAPASKTVSTKGHVEKVSGITYTTTKGYGLICERMAEDFTRGGGKILLSAEVDGVSTADGLCRAVSYSREGRRETVACSHFISTLPINRLMSLLDPAPPPAVLKAAGQIRFRPITFVGVLVSRSPILEAPYIYYRERSFNRVLDLAQFHVEMTPKNSTALIAEITCSKEDRFWTDPEYAKSKVVSEFIEEGLISKDEILETHTFNTEYGYPLYALGFEDCLATIEAELARLPNLHTIGRQGKFAYVNTHVAMKMGLEAARAIAMSSKTS